MVTNHPAIWENCRVRFFLVHAAADSDRCIFLNEEMPFTPGVRIGKQVPGENYSIKLTDPYQPWPTCRLYLRGTLGEGYPPGSSVEPYARS